MKRRAFIRSLASCAAPLLHGCAGAPQPAVLDHEPAAEATPYPFVCGLSFLPDDLREFGAAGITAQITDVSDGVMRTRADGVGQYYRSYAKCRQSIIATAERLGAPDSPAFIATRGEQIRAAHAESRTAVVLQLQSAEPFEDDLSRVEEFHRLGVRVVQLTHNLDNRFAGGYMEPRPTGLTPDGAALLERLASRRMVVDLAHASDQTARDVLAATDTPVVISHGAARALVDHPRCTPDDILRQVGERGGVVG
ncbi:MAG: membrane dipeptidase, partial [Myxococcota bacterium]